MEREEAKIISEKLEAAIRNLGDALRDAQTAMNDEEFEVFKRHIGLAIGRISYELLDPIYKNHPDLAPPGLF